MHALSDGSVAGNVTGQSGPGWKGLAGVAQILAACLGRGAVGVLSLLMAGLAGCSRSEPPALELRVLRTVPELGPACEPLHLNQAITVYFSTPLQPLSVTPATVQVLDASGNPLEGQLRLGSHWVSFVPRVPLTPELTDGAFQPGRSYRLALAGHPRPDALRGTSGQRLVASSVLEFRTVAADLPPQQMLLPPEPALPCILRLPDAPQALPSDDPVLRLQFTTALLPGSVRAESLRIRRLGQTMEELRPSSVRLVHVPGEETPGSTLEVGFAPPLRSRDGEELRPLRAGDWLSIAVRGVASPLLDYAGQPVLAAAESPWTVVAGSSLVLLQFPQDEEVWPGEEDLMPGFELRGGWLRPRVRVEAGDGSLGNFRPIRDTVIRAGQPFDRGDGVQVVDRAGVLPFLAIDIRQGVRVTIEAAAGPLVLTACGGIAIAGQLVLDGPPRPLPPLRVGEALADLLEVAPVALVTAGNLWVGGEIQALATVPDQHTMLLLAAAGRMQLQRELPYNSVLVIESTGIARSAPAIVGLRGQVVTTAATFRYGLPAGARLLARGVTPWRALPPDRDSGELRLLGADRSLRVAWQSAHADAVRRQEPDLRAGQVGRWQPAADRDLLQPGVGSWLRFAVEVDLQGPLVPATLLRQLQLRALR